MREWEIKRGSEHWMSEINTWIAVVVGVYEGYTIIQK